MLSSQACNNPRKSLTVPDVHGVYFTPGPVSGNWFLCSCTDISSLVHKTPSLMHHLNVDHHCTGKDTLYWVGSVQLRYQLQEENFMISEKFIFLSDRQQLCRPSDQYLSGRPRLSHSAVTIPLGTIYLHWYSAGLTCFPPS